MDHAVVFNYSEEIVLSHRTNGGFFDRKEVGIARAKKVEWPKAKNPSRAVDNLVDVYGCLP